MNSGSRVVVTYDDIALMYPDVSERLDKAAVEESIAKATRLLYRLVHNIAPRIAEGTLDPELVKDAIVACVLRFVRNPNPIYNMETELGYQYQINVRTASGELKFLPDELKALRDSPASYGTINIGLGCPMGHRPGSSAGFGTDGRRR